MAVLPIVKTPNPILRQVAKPVGKIDKKILKLVADMVSTLKAQKDPPGVGLAAPQVGISLRVFVMKPTAKSTPMVVINPEELRRDKDKEKDKGEGPKRKAKFLEGCLSLPSFYSNVQRAPSVTLKFTTIVLDNAINVRETTRTFTGFQAQIVQHELDHLNGKLFVDHVLEQKRKLLHLKGDKWEEVNLGGIHDS